MRGGLGAAATVNWRFPVYGVHAPCRSSHVSRLSSSMSFSMEMPS
jgi:hypothetical protein